MRRMLILLITTVLLPIVLTVDATTSSAVAVVADDGPSSAAASPHRKKKVLQKHKEWIRLTGRIERHRRAFTHLEVKNTSGSVAELARAGAAAGEEYACVVRTNRRRVIAYPPLRVSGAGNSFSHRWLLFVYRFDRARRLTVDRQLQQQFEMCAVGGGHTWNKWAANFSGVSTTLRNWPDIRIGQSWGERVTDDGGVSADLGFKLTRGFAEVSASVPVGIDDEHRFSGTDGYDERIDLPDGWDSYNRVNAYYESGDNWTFQGTDRNVGNTLHVLYETPMRGARPLEFILSARFSGHCTKWWQLLGRDCEDFD